MADLSKNAIIYLPENGEPPVGAVQIIHGMGEYQGRYRAIAQFLTSHGYVVVTSDLRGHGNNLSRISELGFFGDNAVSNLLGDIHENTMYLRNHFPNIPVSIIAHGIGALIAAAYLKRYDNFIEGLYLTGMPADRKMRLFGYLICKLLIAIKGEYYRSKIMDFLLVNSYIKQFSRERSTYAWLTSDPEVIENYNSDPKCGFIYTLNGDRTIIELMDATYTSGSWIKKHPDCKIRVLSGSEDACILNRASFMKTVHLFSDHGYKDVAYILYTGKRHDIFQDTGKELVFDDILKELDSTLPDHPLEEEKPVSHHIVLDELDDFIDPEVEQPFQDPDHKINLEAYINAHNKKTPEDKESKVEMVDFMDIESFIKTYGHTSEHPLQGKTEFSEYDAPAQAPDDADLPDSSGEKVIQEEPEETADTPDISSDSDEEEKKTDYLDDLLNDILS